MKDIKHSGQVWAMKLRIPILDPKGWNSVDDFNHVLVTKEEFCNRAAASTIRIDKELSRRSAAKALKDI